MTVPFDETVLRQVRSEVRNIKAQYRNVVPPEVVEMVAGESLQRLANSRVPQFVPLFVGRFTRERIKAMLAAGGAEPGRVEARRSTSPAA